MSVLTRSHRPVPGVSVAGSTSASTSASTSNSTGKSGRRGRRVAGRIVTMSMRAGDQDRPQRPVWLVPVHLLEKITLFVIVAAMIAGLVLEADPSWGYLAYAVAAVGVVVARSRWLPGLMLVAIAPTVAVGLGGEPITLWTVTSFTAFSVAVRGAPAVLTAAIGAVGNAVAQWWSIGAFTGEAFITPGVAALTAVAAAAVGSAIRGNDRYWEALEQRARDAVTGRELLVRQGVAEERVRIARDLHDSVGHAVAVVSMRLGSAEVQLPAGADAARADLAAARTGIQEVLREMQQILQVLRVEDGQTLTPTPDASGVEQLVDVARSAGLDLAADLGDPSDLHRPLPAQVGSATYRIVQEALTNVQKHGTGSARLRLDIAEDGVRIEVVNPSARTGPPPTWGTGAIGGMGLDRSSGGHGLIGMCERATAAGGRLEVSHDGDVFRVRAHLPVRRGDVG
ncbi:integral membrane sensor signal transduction histidine kinase [Kineococcus radiotolerans SRS30216 = ATCC BAA-149]|uniref:histidine kinase n=2 Tax=Kineococcus radiotolerans TaxID=131568 RepID=A6WBE2_KINRD|nr:integral membrane sensor signal transduction histidine kinase [Kineococcus radiotolerans SRS30216 = ATCC BAA-149]